ncbi:MAG TPA: MXAN_5187 C-terminal domain-containing protein [Vulgatibacter sp.]|nr:MXAN_5187 C-terminal domain-containing protein [Vulgatibacter sp.]
MFRPSLLLVILAALAAGGANLYLGGVEAVRNAERGLDERLDRAAKSLRTTLAEDAQRAAAAAEPGADPGAEAAEPEIAARPPAAFDDAQARRLAALAGADVTLIRAGKVEASSLGAAARNELARAAAAAAAASFGAGEIPADELALFGLPLPLFAPDRAQWRGHAGAVPGVDELEVVVSVSTLDAYGAVASAQKRELGIGATLLAFSLVVLVASSRRKDSNAAIAAMADVVERAADGDATAHAAEYHPGDLGRLARALNRLSARFRQASATHQASAQSALPQRSEEEPPEDLSDSFPFGPSQMGASPGPIAAAEPEPAAGSAPEASTGASFLEASATPGPFADPFGTMPGVVGAEHEAPEAETAEPPTWEKTRTPATEEPAPAPPPPSAPPPADPYGQAIAEAAGGGTFNPEATVVAAIPEALLRATSRAAAPQAEIDPEELHIEQVFQDFLRLRSECGESTAGLTLEKFAAKLRNNRAQLMEKYRCRTVRFTAYVKDGKAALKASPVKESA